MILENSNELESFQKLYQQQDSIVIPISSDTNKHPVEDDLCLLYVQMMSGEEFILPFNHSETLNIDIPNLDSKTKKYTYDKKKLTHFISLNNVIDVNLSHYMKTNQPYDFDKHLTNAHHHNYRLHYEKENINDIIPLVKHAEYFSKVSVDLLNYLEDHEYYDQEILEVLSKVENNGIQTTDGLVYSEYNPYTSTGRPSNRFGGLNFAALNKKDGSRKQFISRFENGVLVEFDYDAYHPRLIGDKIKYKFPNGSVHQHLADTYGLSYDDGKSLTFKYLYGGITHEIKDNPFFSKVDKYVQQLWNTWKGNKIIKSDIYNREISRKNLSDMNPNKLFNYMIQLMETEHNMAVLEQLLPTIENNRSKLVLYNYDAFLFDFDISEGLDYLNNVKTILEQDGKYPTRVSMGSNYHEMKDITEKFK